MIGFYNIQQCGIPVLENQAFILHRYDIKHDHPLYGELLALAYAQYLKKCHNMSSNENSTSL